MPVHRVLTPATVITVWMSRGEQIQPQLVNTSIPDVMMMTTGMAGTGCLLMVRVPRCQSHVLAMAGVAHITQCGLSALTHS